jgi:hypothetical protein
LGAEVVPVTVDTRYPTTLEFLGGSAVHLSAGAEYDLAFNLTRSDTGAPVPEVYIDVCMNGTVHYPYYIRADGTSRGPWPDGFTQGGVYFFTASFAGDWYHYRPSNETRFVIVVSVTPIMVVFDVEPREFEPGSSITLFATVLNVTSQDPLPGFVANFYEIMADGTSFLIGSSTTNASGVATRAWQYGQSGVRAYTVLVASGQQMMTSPVTLTVAKSTSLTLNVSLLSGYNYNVSGYLRSGADPAIGKTLQIYVNNTLKTNVTTGDPHGNFNFTLNLPSVNDQPTTYNVQATFQGDTPSNATAYGYTPNGTQYAVCTTTQYGYKPSSNCTALKVEPQTTQVITAAKTMGQMQQEAEGSGQLSTKPRFDWWYPWFWLETTVCHAALNFSLVTCTSLFGGWMGDCHGLENTLYTMFAGVTSQEVDVLTSAAVSSVTTAAAIFVGGYIATSPWIYTIVGYPLALSLYFGVGTLALYSMGTVTSALFGRNATRAVLTTAGFTLLALSTLGFTKTIPIFVSKISGQDPVTAAVKCIVNAVLGYQIVSWVLAAMGAMMLNLGFYITTFVLSLVAFYLAWSWV